MFHVFRFKNVNFSGIYPTFFICYIILHNLPKIKERRLLKKMDFSVISPPCKAWWPPVISMSTTF